MAVISIDAGTTGIRAFVVDRGGAPVARAYREFAQHFPRPGWIEHDAEEIWSTTATVLTEAAGLLAELLPGEPVDAVGITNQRDGRRVGRPHRTATVPWCGRTAARGPRQQLGATGTRASGP